MPKQTFQIGPFNAAYIGLTGQSTALTQLNSVRTNGAEQSENLPSEYVVSIDGPVQTGDHTVGLTLEFIGTADEVTCLVRGLPPGSDINNPIGQNQYALFVAVGEGEDNYYFPKVRTEKSYKRSYNKRSTTNTVVVFTGEKRSVTDPIMYKGSLVLMASAMGSQYPL